MRKGWFNDWFGTPYYTMLYGRRDEGEARRQVEAILRLTGTPRGAAVLDVGCGRGRHAHWFSGNGLVTVGLDICPEAVAEAAERVPTALFKVHDMRQAFGRADFDLVVNLFTSFGYFDERSDDTAAVHNMFQALRPGGSLVIDFMNTPRVISALVASEECTIGHTRFVINRRVHDGFIEKSIRVEDEDARRHFMERVIALTPAEIRDLLEQEGFHLRGVFGDFDGGPYEPETSERAILWAQRPLE
ncbi:MAG: class I SAM-dependent methyltransferase [Flavobacteriales bacterium]|nr:MAG: class I SAM-dependent methyltransferase [Flavobacteriales bacterium]